MMKILIINWQDIRNPASGGAEVHLHEIFCRIAAMGHQVTLYCSSFEGAKQEETIDGVKVIRKGSRQLFNFGVKRKYKRDFENEGYDIVIDDINKIPFYTPRYVRGPLLALSHHFFGRSIYRETNILIGTYVLIAEKLVDLFYRNTKFAVVSQSTLDEFMMRGYSRENFTIIENAIDHSRFPMSVGKKNDKPTLTYFGRLKKYKSPDHLLKAFALVKERYREAELYIMGTGDYLEGLRKLAVKLGISDSTTFFGYVSEAQKTELLSKSWLVINTSQKEGWGITNIEANASGTAVVSANVPGLRDSVKVGLSGELYEYGKIKELARTIENIIGHEENLRNYSVGAVEWAEQFSWDQSAQKMLELIKEVTQK